jgi:hypothetical protein
VLIFDEFPLKEDYFKQENEHAYERQNQCSLPYFLFKRGQLIETFLSFLAELRWINFHNVRSCDPEPCFVATEI